MSNLSALPDEVLKRILQRVPLQHRLGSCCLVSKRLHAAAVAASHDLDLQSSRSTRSKDSLLQWLPHYGHHVTRLHLAYFMPSLQQLPCPNLVDLQLSSCSVQLGAADALPGVVQGCSKLTRLELGCYIIDLPHDGVLDSLSSLVHLHHLHVKPTNVSTIAGLSGATLPRLQQLTYLRVEKLNVENLLQLSSLTSLQELHLTTAVDMVVGPSSVPGLVFPGCLTMLGMYSSSETAVLSLVPTGLQKLVIDCSVEGPAEGHVSFLSCMARLQHLTELSLQYCEGLALPPAGPAYSALTASSKLVVLDLLGIELLPLGSWPHMFSVSRHWPHLTSLSLGMGVDESGAVTPMGAADFSNLVSCCPALCSVGSLSLLPGLHVSELHKLTALTRVHVDYWSDTHVNCEEGSRGLAAVTQLKHLDLYQRSPTFQVASLLPLTSLTALSQLDFLWHTNDYSERVTVHLQVGSGPDVWLQLLQRCAADPDCQPIALRMLAQQLAEQRTLNAQQLTDQQQQLLVQEQRMLAQEQRELAQEQRLLVQEQRMLAQEQRILAQEQLIAAQQQQIARMQGQLQALHAAVQPLLQSQQH